MHLFPCRWVMATISSTFAAPSMPHAARCNAARGMLHGHWCASHLALGLMRRLSRVCPMRSSETHTPRPILAMRRCGFKPCHVPLRMDGQAPSTRPAPAAPAIPSRGAASSSGLAGCLARCPFGGASWRLRAMAGCGRRRLAYRIVKSLLSCDAPQRSTAADGCRVGSECRFALQWQHDPRVPSVSYHHLSKVCAHALAPAAGNSASYSANRRKLRRFIAFQDCKHYECHCTLLPFWSVSLQISHIGLVSDGAVFDIIKAVLNTSSSSAAFVP